MKSYLKILEIAIVANVLCLIIAMVIIVVETINETEPYQIDNINCEVQYDKR